MACYNLIPAFLPRPDDDRDMDSMLFYTLNGFFHCFIVSDNEWMIRERGELRQRDLCDDLCATIVLSAHTPSVKWWRCWPVKDGWSTSVPNLSGKLRRGSLRYRKAVELADVLGYDLVWQKRRA